MDYTRCSLDELRDLETRLDPDTLPDDYKRLQRELARREAQIAAGWSEEDIQMALRSRAGAASWVCAIIGAVWGGLSAVMLYLGLAQLVVSYRGGGVVMLAVLVMVIFPIGAIVGAILGWRFAKR